MLANICRTLLSNTHRSKLEEKGEKERTLKCLSQGFSHHQCRLWVCVSASPKTLGLDNSSSWRFPSHLKYPDLSPVADCDAPTWSTALSRTVSAHADAFLFKYKLILGGLSKSPEYGAQTQFLKYPVSFQHFITGCGPETLCSTCVLLLPMAGHLRTDLPFPRGKVRPCYLRKKEHYKMVHTKILHNFARNCCEG